MRIARGACPKCKGDLFLDYKANRPSGGMHKCVQCSMVFSPLVTVLSDFKIEDVK
jgi:hypothetical protein